MNVLVFNVGSTSLKYAAIDSVSGQRIHSGLVDRIGQPDGDATDHRSATKIALNDVADTPFSAIGHRIVQGGNQFSGPTRVSAESMKILEQLDSLAPLHNPPARSVAESLCDRPEPQVMVFDTAFFASLSPSAYQYALPRSICQQYGIRRYGFHGTSHQYVTEKTLEYLGGQSSKQKIITLHLGGGASAAASIGGIAVDSSMGMTPLEGLVMATRCGTIDPAIPLFLIRHADMSADEVDKLLNRQSGLLGLCNEADMRTVLQREKNGDETVSLALDVYVRQIVKTVGSFFAILGGLDALVFTAGIGQNSAEIRSRIVTQLEHLGVSIDDQQNRTADGTLCDLTPDTGNHLSDITRTLMVATDEEFAIAKQVAAYQICASTS